MTTKNAKGPEELKEFKGSDGNNVTADPHVTSSSARAADKSDGMIAIPDFATKAEVMQQIIGTIHTMDKEQLANIYKGLESVSGKSGRAADKTAGETGQISLSPTSVKPTHSGDIHPTMSTVTHSGPEQHTLRISPTSVVAKEDIDDIFGAEELSEDIKERTRVIFEAKINSTLMAEMVRIEEEAEEYLNEAVENIRVELTEKVDEYLSYVVNEWVEDNEIAIETGLKAEMAETFLESLKNLFMENYIDVDEEKPDAMNELLARIEELEDNYNSLVNENLELKNENNELRVGEVFAEATAGLSETQIDKLMTLSEGIVYSNPDEFASKLDIIKENYIKSPTKKAADFLSEENGVDPETIQERNSNSEMDNYIKTTQRLFAKS